MFLKGARHIIDWKTICYVLGRGSDFLSVLVPLQFNCGVCQVDHQADLSTFIHLICWFQFLCKSFEKQVTIKIIPGLTVSLDHT